MQDVLTVKGELLHTIGRESTVLDATRKMNQHKIGALVVMDEGRVVGMFTERDVLQRVVAQEVPPASVRVGDVMTREVVCCQPDDDLDEVSAIMKQRRVRHVPVCDSAGALHGIISMGDVNAQYASNAEQQIHFLNEYIYGRA
ncbi:MAG: CBS domain-containing protein [Phycisphaerae bacterium]|nr:CBS domain-containing protein [Tepidisphaeraceae bacterium]